MASGRTRHALLIGIDFYFPGELRPIVFPSLNGCVYDVQAVESFLSTIRGCQIRKLTSSVDPAASSTPVETDKSTWPTCANIKQALEEIEEEAKPGGLVYVHYSGHGIRRAHVSVEGEGDSITGTALVPLDVNTGGAYLTGYQLGVWIRRMVEGPKRLRVTLVLDSCFSGGGLRKANGIPDTLRGPDSVFLPRTVENAVDKTNLPSDDEADMAAVKADLYNNSTRNAMLRQSWLDNPTGCTALTACQSNEVAMEYHFMGENSRSGVLTFLLLRLLREHSLAWPTYATVIEQVRLKIKNMRPSPSQLPGLHGDAYYEFFGDKAHQRPACRVLRTHNKYVELAVGRAQGTAVGSRYDVYPRVSHANANGRDALPEVKPMEAQVIQLDDFKSTTELVGDARVPDQFIIDSECQAVLKSWALSSHTYVDFPNNRAFHDMRSILKKSIESMPGLHLLGKSQRNDATFTVSVDTDGAFSINDRNGRLPRIPRIAVKDRNRAQKLGYILRHLSRFRDIMELRSHDPSTALSASSFEFSLLDKDSNPIAPSPTGTYELTNDQTVIISFINRLPNAPAYVSFFNLNATWGIEKLFPSIGQTAWEFGYCPPRLDNDALMMQIPGKAHKEDPEGCDDVFRAYVYVGKEPPVWDELVLADLPLTAADLDLDAVESALVPLGATRNSKKLVSAGPAADERGRWTVLDLVIHTRPAGLATDRLI